MKEAVEESPINKINLEHCLQVVNRLIAHCVVVTKLVTLLVGGRLAKKGT